jgi:hypothetical protein
MSGGAAGPLLLLVPESSRYMTGTILPVARTARFQPDHRSSRLQEAAQESYI